MIHRSKSRRVSGKNHVTLLSLVKDCFMLMSSFLSFEDVSRCCRTSVTAQKLFGESLGKTRDIVMTTRNCSAVQRHCRKLESLAVRQDEPGQGCEPYIANLLKSNKKLEKLTLYKIRLSLDICNVVSGLTQLKRVRFKHCRRSADAPQKFIMPPNLSLLHLWGRYPAYTGVQSSMEYLLVACDEPVPPNFLSSLKRSCPRLKGLTFTVSQQSVHELAYLKHLTELCLFFSSLNVSIFHTFQNLELLKLVSFQHGNTDDVAKGLPVIGTWCKRLKGVSLLFPYCELGDNVVSFLKACNPRELLVICKQTKAAIFKIFKENMTMPNLQCLHFGEWDGDLGEVLKFAPNLKEMSAFFKDPPVIGNSEWRSKTISRYVFDEHISGTGYRIARV